MNQFVNYFSGSDSMLFNLLDTVPRAENNVRYCHQKRFVEQKLFKDTGFITYGCW